jgi:hypothetical protein
MTLGIVIPIIEEEIIHLYKNLNILISNLSHASLVNYKICIICQTKNVVPKISHDFVNVIKTEHYSVSYARNIGLRYFHDKSSYIYFLDFDAIPSTDFLIESKKNILSGLNIWSGNLKWTNDFNYNQSKSKFNYSYQYQMKTISSLPYHQFLGCFVFKKSLLLNHGIYFEESLGPGKKTSYKSGEDVLLLAEIFSKNNIDKYKFYKDLNVYHPPRNNDNLKSLIYCNGAVYVNKLIIKSRQMHFKLRVSSFLYLILFILNGFKKFIFFERNSFKLLKKRISAILNI